MNKEKIQKKIDSMLSYGDWCRVNKEVKGENEEGNEETFLNVKDDVFVCGTQPVPEDEGDVYNLRLKIIVAKVVDDHVQSDRMFLADPANLSRLGKTRSNKLTKIYEKDFGGTVETTH